MQPWVGNLPDAPGAGKMEVYDSRPKAPHKRTYLLAVELVE